MSINIQELREKLTKGLLENLSQTDEEKAKLDDMKVEQELKVRPYSKCKPDSGTCPASRKLPEPPKVEGSPFQNEAKSLQKIKDVSQPTLPKVVSENGESK